MKQLAFNFIRGGKVCLAQCATNNDCYNSDEQCYLHGECQSGCYDCTTKNCDWKEYTEGVDWGYYSKTNGECT